MAKKLSRQPTFHIGDSVRVRLGVSDPDYKDIPLGGWVGTIKEIQRSPKQYLYLIAWSQETLKNVHPVFRKRAERDDLDYEEMWLADEDIEAYDGQPLLIEQPTCIETRPLSPDNQDDRIKAILGATGDDPVPDVDEEMLINYWKYLNEHLTMPFQADHYPEDGPSSTVTVVRLSDPEEYDCDEFYGLFCEAQLGQRHITILLGEIELRKNNPNRQLVEDYSYWFWNWR